MKKRSRKRLLRLSLLLAMLLTAGGSYAQQAELPELMIHFRAGDPSVNLSYMNNRIALSKLSMILTPQNAPYVSSVQINGYASPEGVSVANEKLSWDRAESLKRHIIMSYYPQIQSEKITVMGMGINWEELRRMAEADYRLPRRSEVLYVIDYVHAHIDVKTNTSRKKSLMDLGPETWNYMMRNYFPLLRTGGAKITVFLHPDTPSEITDLINSTLSGIEEQATPTAIAKSTEEPCLSDTIYVEKIVEIEKIIEIETGCELERKPLFALKTNLLFDVASVLNVEVEIPLGKRWSIAGEYIFPWWLNEDKQRALQMLSGNLELRYWFGNRAERPVMTGWYGGLYGGGGYFDLEWETKGYQGEFFIAAGVSAGYAHTISKNGNWRMEYGLGLGYMQTKYREYVPKFGLDDEWHLIRQRDGVHKWFGPTKAKVSLVWMINHGYKKKGGAK